jgi:multidrug resistance efflux pump
MRAARRPEIIRAPQGGQLGQVGVRLGQYVTNGTQLMVLVPAYRWIIANYKEAQTAHMAVGQVASFRVDAEYSNDFPASGAIR